MGADIGVDAEVDGTQPPVSLDVLSSRHKTPSPPGDREGAVPVKALNKSGDEQATADYVVEIQHSKRRWLLLAIFSLSLALDIAARSGTLSLVAPIIQSLDIPLATSSWVSNSYGVPFGAFLALWGRVCDLWSPKPVFWAGFLGFGIFNLAVSFVTNQYAFYILRAIAGVASAATIPSAYRLIMTCFPKNEVPIAITIFSTTAGLSNAASIVLGGAFGTISARGELEGWRWYFRFLAIDSVMFAGVAILLAPDVRGTRATASEKWKQFDLPGCALLLLGTLLFALGLTLGASFGWKTAAFLVPFLLSWPIFLFFFWWERRLPDGYAIVPTSFWRLVNMPLVMFVALVVNCWYPLTAFPLIQYWQSTYNETVIKAAGRFSPACIAPIIYVAFFGKYIGKTNTRWTLAIALAISGSSLLLLIFSGGRLYHGEYWRWSFPGFIIGGAITGVLFGTMNVWVMQSVPLAMTGMASALLNIGYQLGVAIGFAIQAGLMTIKPGDVENFANIQASFWFQFGWYIMLAILVALFIKPVKQADTPSPSSADTAERAG